MTLKLHGGCLCRAVRYRLSQDPFEAGYCHCRMCQLATGSPVAAFATVELDAYIIEAGSPQRRRSSNLGERWHCRECGTPLAMHVDHQPTTIDVTIATLDNPGLIVPSFHIWTERAIPWFETDDGLPRYQRFRSVTPGLMDASIEAKPVRRR